MTTKVAAMELHRCQLPLKPRDEEVKEIKEGFEKEGAQ